jgi:hypothetical protein
LYGFGTRGRVGVTGMALGGVFGGRAAACFANASATYSFDTIGGWAVVVACLKGLAFIDRLLISPVRSGSPVYQKPFGENVKGLFPDRAREFKHLGCGTHRFG